MSNGSKNLVKIAYTRGALNIFGVNRVCIPDYLYYNIIDINGIYSYTIPSLLYYMYIFDIAQHIIKPDGKILMAVTVNIVILL